MDPENNTATSRFGSVRVAGDSLDQSVLVNGRRVVSGNDLYGGAVDFFWAGAKGQADVFILGGRGGSACPYTMAVVEITAARKVMVSKSFGTCSHIMRASMTGDRVVITMLDYLNPDDYGPRARSRLHLKQYTYRVGRVSAARDLGLPTRADQPWMRQASLIGAPAP